MNKITIIIFILLLPFITFSQGQSPNSVKWMEINTEHAQFIFPKEITSEAQKAANLIEHLYSIQTKTLDTKPKKVPIILYNQSTTSNGFAALRPRRSVWFSTPSQYASSLGTDDWFYTLGTHEFRHIVQYSKSNKYFTKFLSTLFGQTGLLMGEYSIPYWFFEGDAVCTETSLSKGGRGRIAQFDMPIRTILSNDINITYDQAKFGSYKTFYPSYYNLGYLMTSQAREIYGANVWDKTLTHTSKISFWPYAFSKGLKKTTGLNEKNLYEEVMTRLNSEWKDDLNKIELKEVNIINTKEKKSWTKYSEVKYLNENEIIAKKSSLKSDIQTFYIINRDGEEEKIKATDAGMISVANDKIVWSRKYYNPRWQVKDYSDIIIYNLNSRKERRSSIKEKGRLTKEERIMAKKQRRLTKKQKLFAPALSHDGKLIAAVSYDTKMQTCLVLIDSKTGKQLKSFKSPDNDYIRTPVWDKLGKRIVFTQTNQTGTALSYFDIETERFHNITDYTAENIGRPIFYKDYIIYNSPYNGIGNIYAIHIDSKERFQLTSVKYGAYNPDILNDKMIFANYGAEGYDIAEIDLIKKNFKSLSEINEYTFKTAELLQKQEQGKNILDPALIPDTKFEIKKYKKLKHAFNIHSWGLTSDYPIYYDADYLRSFRPEIGAEIYTANMLNTVFGVAGVKYNADENTFRSDVSLILKKYYPTFTISGTWAQRSLNYGDLGYDYWTEYKSTASMSLPLNFSKGIYYKGANLNTSYSLVHRKGKDYRYISESTDGNFHSFLYNASIYAFRHQSNMDINPKFGYFLYANYKHTPLNTNIYGEQFSALASFYLPSFIKHHSINIKTGIEKQRDDYNINNYYWYGSPQPFPRGFEYVVFTKFKSAQINYTFPIYYPDFNIGPLAYFKRIRGNVFYDYADIQTTDNSTNNYQSVGLELFIQVYLFRLGEPIEVGGRFSYLLDGSQNLIPEFLVLNIPF